MLKEMKDTINKEIEYEKTEPDDHKQMAKNMKDWME